MAISKNRHLADGLLGELKRDKNINTKVTVGIVMVLVVLFGLPMAFKLRREYVIAANTYHLVSVEGHVLPFAPRHRGRQDPEIVSGAITMYNDGTFHAAMTCKNPSGGTLSREFKGTYPRERSISSLNWDGAGETPVTMENNRLTMDSEGLRFVYEK